MKSNERMKKLSWSQSNLESWVQSSNRPYTISISCFLNSTTVLLGFNKDVTVSLAPGFSLLSMAFSRNRLVCPLVLCLYVSSTVCKFSNDNNWQEIVTLDDGTTIQLEHFTGPNHWALAKHMFTASRIVVNCHGHKDFSVYVSHDVDGVREAYNSKSKAWCGWEHFSGHNPSVCVASAFPIGTTVVAVAKPPSLLSASSHECSMTREDEFSMPRFLSTLLGGFLFWCAPSLAESTPFRLAGGTVSFMALSGILLLFIIYRSLPHKGKLFAAVTLFGSSVMATARWILGTWVPSLRLVLTNPITLGYMVISGLAGLALTYYFNDTSSHKFNTILKVALQLLGLGLIALSVPSTETGIGAIVALLSMKAYNFLARHPTISSAFASAKSNIGELVTSKSPLPGFGPKQLGRVKVGHIRGNDVALVGADRSESPPTPSMPTGWRVFQGKGRSLRFEDEAKRNEESAVSPLVERGMVLNEDTGRLIHIGKSTYKSLVEAGYVVDLQKGTVAPPGSGEGKSRAPQSRRRKS